MTIGEKYIVSLYWSAATGASVGYGDISATHENNVEVGSKPVGQLH